MGKVKPTIEFRSSGESGNIYWILCEVRKALQKRQRITEYNELWERVQKSTSYDEALSIIREMINLVDLDGRC